MGEKLNSQPFKTIIDVEVKFQKNIDKVTMSKSIIKNQNKSTADILVRFFDFYCRDFNFFD